MADKEPRRRRKRKEAPRKDEAVRDFSPGTSHQASMPSRESDQELEEDYAPSHSTHEEPSKIAQIVFMLFFMLLAGILSSLFIALRGTPDSYLEEHLEILQPVTFETEEVVLFDEHASLESEDLHMFEVPTETEDVQDEDNIDSEDDLEPVPTQPEEPVSSPSETIEKIVEPTISKGKEEHVEEAATLPPEIVKERVEDEIENMPIVSDDDDNDDEIVTPSPLQDKKEPESSATKVSEEVTHPQDTTTISHSKEDDSHNIADNQIPPAEDSILDAEEEDEEDETTQQLPEEKIADELDDLDFSNYEKADITNEADYIIREELDAADKILEKSPDMAVEKFNSLLKTYPFSPRALYGKARALDILAAHHRSNTMLEDAIATYQKVMTSKEVPTPLYLLAGERCAERMQFRGYVGKSIKVLVEMAEKFPKNVQLKNKVAVGYLLIGQEAKAKEVLTEIIKDHPKNGFAQVHLGYILKIKDSNYKEAIRLLSEGIATREEGVIDGRFYYHLGDALSREGKVPEAMKVYEDAVKENLFPSVYQRSLYNVNGLSAKPWWDPESTKYSRHFQILEKNWEAIKTEALTLAGKNMLMPENEGLKDGGDWHQFELFVRGRKIAKNCASAPLTCSLVEQMSDASTCKRGQVKFSIMQPGTHVWAHVGPTNCRIRSHLGLVIPDGTRIRVANETRTWKNGKILLFDDSFEHEVWHNGTSPRLVLIVDFWHPELSSQQKASLSPI